MSDQHNLVLKTEKYQAATGMDSHCVDIVIDVPGEQRRPLEPETLSEKKDGGSEGWLTVAGSWLILFSTLGSGWPLQKAQYDTYTEASTDYYTRIFLPNHSPSSIAWMGSFQLALPFAMGPLAGRVFDAGHARLLVAAGSLLFLFSLFMLSLAQQGQYYQVFLSQGVGIGAGTGLLFTPSTAIVSVHFRRRRSLAYGTALTGISIGALVFPIGEPGAWPLRNDSSLSSNLSVSRLLFRIGFGSAVRATGFITLGCLLAGNALIRPPPRVTANRRSADIATFFHDPVYLWFLLMAVVSLLSIYFPAIYLQLYAVDHNIGDSLAFYSIAILNGVGIVGRVGSTWLADKYGIWNVQIPVTLGTAATIWAIIGTHNPATLVAISCLYGIFSGAWLAVSISGLVSLASSPNEVGATPRRTTFFEISLDTPDRLFSKEANGLRCGEALLFRQAAESLHLYTLLLHA
ncbi:hypothetical protein NP233_g1311 [Leucocoprinus birnbaumii]|uniref:MFS general substrate transporter n=1 Tax=Leucocoprinus birnbaumii TaxID=56174 RepID=A0AAD5W093_9AGAR|nr:hypothetical protein NP233_g1311 [Leucocoprinus birnbaumii]